MEVTGLVLYQVCVDRAGDMPFDGAGILHDDIASALADLAQTRRRLPHAYLAMLTYRRCVEHTYLDPIERECLPAGGSSWIQ